MADTFKDDWQPKILKLARTKTAFRSLVKEMEDAIQDDEVRTTGEHRDNRLFGFHQHIQFMF